MSLAPIPLPLAGLTLLPPWSAYILFAGKRTENRTPSVAGRIGPWRGFVALGCSKNFDETEAAFIARETKAQPWFKWRGPKPFPFDTFKEWAGHVVGVAELIDVRRNGFSPLDPWASPGECGLIFGRVWQVEPIACSGGRGLCAIGGCAECGHIGSIENRGEPLMCRRCKRVTTRDNLGRPSLKVLDIFGPDGERES